MKVLVSLLAGGGVAALLAQPASVPSPPLVAPNVLVITVDTLRPDALGWVAGKNRTPRIDALAREAFRFPAAVAPVPLTLPSHVSLFTGLNPLRHGVRDNGQVMGRGTATLAEILRERRYATGAFVSGFPLRASFGLDSGFERYDDLLPSGREGWVERSGAQTTVAALTWIRTARTPWFAWVHYYEPHDPYTPPPALLRPGPRGAYDGEVAAVDAAVTQLLGGLRVSDPRNLITVFAGDHGESLGEHGESTHGFFLYDTTVLVPLLIHAPGRVAPGQSLSPARLIDVTPTVLDLLRQPPLRDADGSSLLPLLRGKSTRVPPAHLETHQPWLAYGWAPLSGMREEGWKFIKAPKPELYDLRVDPGEGKNLAGISREHGRRLARALEVSESRRPIRAATTADAETASRLRSLGYLSAGASGQPPPKGLADPKDRLRERELLLEGETLLRESKFDAAQQAFGGVLQREPRNPFALFRSGVAFLKRGDLPRAIGRLEEAVRVGPAQPEAQFALADALTRTGQFGRALPHWFESVRLAPRSVPAWANLGTVLLRERRLRDASRALARAVELEPNHSGLLTTLAQTERALGDHANSLKHLTRAASLTPEARFQFSGMMGLLLRQRGANDEALRWLRRSRQGEPDHAEGLFALASLELSGGNREAARRALHEALAAQPALRSRAESDRSLAELLR